MDGTNTEQKRLTRAAAPASAVPTVGVVVARTGRLARLGDPLAYAMDVLGPKLRGRLRLVARDSRSGAGGARQAVRELVEVEGARIVLTLAGTEVLPAVAGACEEAGVPCLSSAFPWQVYYYGGRRRRWTYHFCWGLDDIAETFADLWEASGGTERTVGCLWNDGPQGSWSRRDTHGFLPAARARGHRLVDPAGYREPAAALDGHVTAFREAGVDVVTSAATGADLGVFRREATARGLRPRLITCSRWLAYPPAPGTPAGQAPQANVATLVYWTPGHPYRSSLDGTTPAELAEGYERATGDQWLQPLGLAYALFEVAAHALATATDPTVPESVAAALGATRLETIAGLLDWTSGPEPHIATVRLAGGQWQRGRTHPYELVVVDSRRVEGLRADGELLPLGATDQMSTGG
ncbi:ABC transporter substrate-binding protein [Streptomyces ficellus]|uniref:ABC transporter substrate-binding protein n=1 Tax=Streptomyces ficellus TaxID=1977088 RepID=A0A6I6F150_9ACTN|nr:ABC transporter substrate-binding protein [Streptomyces ficellus]QGV77653.1 ABC transporter substrate-binding protein [Streptomyces ficellus]